jgi:hypothetical protein
MLVQLLRLCRTGVAVTPETRERMNTLCKRIQEEEDRVIFNKLITELNELLDESFAPSVGLRLECLLP